MQQQPNTAVSQHAPSLLRPQRPSRSLASGLGRLVLGLSILCALLGGKAIFAQTQTPKYTQTAPQQRGAAEQQQSSNNAAGHVDAASAQRTPAPAATAAQASVPSGTTPPADLPPDEARVIWDGRDLRIEAFNASLKQILHQVAVRTGASLEGQIHDQRVFGSFGPGPGCDVLSELLDGSGYNVLMMGSRDADAPLAIVLSPRPPAAPQTASNRSGRGSLQDVPAAEQPSPDPQSDISSAALGPPPSQNPFANGEHPADSMQFMQEILDRQQHIDQQQQEQQNHAQP